MDAELTISIISILIAAAIAWNVLGDNKNGERGSGEPRK